MKKLTIRVDDDVWLKLREEAGWEGINAVVERLIVAYLGGAPRETTRRRRQPAAINDPSMPAATAVMPPSAVPSRAEEVHGGDFCAAIVRGKRCGRAASHWKGPVAFCEEHR